MVDSHVRADDAEVRLCSQLCGRCLHLHSLVSAISYCIGIKQEALSRIASENEHSRRAK